MCSLVLGHDCESDETRKEERYWYRRAVFSSCVFSAPQRAKKKNGRENSKAVGALWFREPAPKDKEGKRNPKKKTHFIAAKSSAMTVCLFFFFFLPFKIGLQCVHTISLPCVCMLPLKPLSPTPYSFYPCCFTLYLLSFLIRVSPKLACSYLCVYVK